MIAAMEDHADVMKVLLDKGADLSVANTKGWTASHLAAAQGKLSVTLVLVKAGADLDMASVDGGTPLHAAAENGHSEVMEALIAAGANVDSRSSDGQTPRYGAARYGHIDAVRVLLRAEANPLLARTISGYTIVPLDVAALHGHSEMVRELIQHVGIVGCGGESGGEKALEAATQCQRIGVMSILADAGVADTGKVLAFATDHGLEAAVKFLLQQHEKGKSAGGSNYANNTCIPRRSGVDGITPRLAPLDRTILFARSPRVVRLLIDAGADTAACNGFDLDTGGVRAVTAMGHYLSSQD